MSVVQLDLGELADEWQDAIDTLDPQAPDDEIDELNEVIERCKQLCVDLGLSPVEPSALRWAESRLGLTLIRADTFTEYAQEFAEDIHGDLDGLESYIDWEKYANAMRADYYELTYDGHEWLRRA